VLTEGDRVAADARVISAGDLSADESLLTGEAEAVAKRAAAPDAAPAQVLGDPGMVYAGTLLVGGQGGIYASADAGKTWKHVFQQGWVSSLVADGNVVVGNGAAGLLRSTDGEHWDCVLADAGAVYTVRLVDGRFAAVRNFWRYNDTAEMASMRISSDHGQTWQQLDDGMTSKTFYDVDQAGSNLFCSHKDGISRSTDGGNNWKLVRPGEPVEQDKPMTVELAGSGKIIFAVRAWNGC